MSILLDTNAFLWFITDNSLLSESNGNYIENFSNTIYLSIASIWEIAIKFSIGKLESTLSSFEIVFDEIEKNGIELLVDCNVKLVRFRLAQEKIDNRLFEEMVAHR